MMSERYTGYNLFRSTCSNYLPLDSSRRMEADGDVDVEFEELNRFAPLIKYAGEPSEKTKKFMLP